MHPNHVLYNIEYIVFFAQNKNNKYKLKNKKR